MGMRFPILDRLVAGGAPYRRQPPYQTVDGEPVDRAIDGDPIGDVIGIPGEVLQYLIGRERLVGVRQTAQYGQARRGHAAAGIADAPGKIWIGHGGFHSGPFCHFIAFLTGVKAA
jgi:hypothetical protein